MTTFFLGIVIFLVILAVFDLVVGVSNDAVNFLNSAVGAKTARFGVVATVAAAGVFIGAAMSNGMMDVARHGIMQPQYFSFYDVMCVFLAVMVTDVLLLDVFNTLGMPTSTTVSMVFELLGGAFAVAVIKIAGGAALSFGDLLNTEKALSVILGIFLSVPAAFLLGSAVQWAARMVFTFTYSQPASAIKTGIFSGLALTVIVWFLLINGLKGTSIMTPEVKDFVNQNRWLILGCCFAVFSTVLTVLSALKIPVFKFVILSGTFALATAFAGNDLVNFVGVPLAGLDAYNDFTINGMGSPSEFMMTSLAESARTPALYLVAAGTVMVLSLFFSQKARNVVNTSVDLSRQDVGGEMFGSSGMARGLVRTVQKIASDIARLMPQKVSEWIDSRFNSDAAVLAKGAAFDQIRATVNLVVAGLLVALGTNMKLPLSTTYVTFMVAMGASLADRAWSRESAVFRVTGVLSVIGGWFLTAGAAFTVCFVVTNILSAGSFVAMILAVLTAIVILVRSHIHYAKKQEESEADGLFDKILQSGDKAECWTLLRRHVMLTENDNIRQSAQLYEALTTAFFAEDYRTLKRTAALVENRRNDIKRQRRRHIIALRRIDPVLSVEKGTWYFLTINSLAQMFYCLKRMGEPCREHVGNSFSPVPKVYADEFEVFSNGIVRIFNRAVEGKPSEEIRSEASALQSSLSEYRKKIICDIQTKRLNIESMTVFLNLVQESQELLGSLRHAVRGGGRFGE